MDIEVLGGLRALENGVPVVPQTQPARQVFAVLAAYADQMVPTTVLAAELSAYAPDGEHARSVLLTSIRQIRELLAGAADSAGRRTPEAVLVSLPGGFLLDTDGGRSDQGEFARETGAGYRAMARGSSPPPPGGCAGRWGCGGVRPSRGSRPVRGSPRGSRTWRRPGSRH